MPGARPHLDTLCVNTIRTLAMDMVEAARSGHPGAPMGLAPAGYALFTGLLRHDPRDPAWPDRDRFILSNGHASALLYSLLFLCGYAVTLEDLRQFRQWGSKTPGHPEARHTPGVETTTGPLGQGIANAVGLAIAERHLAARFNRGRLKVVDHWTYVFCGDGDLMEGVAAEAASLAGHLGLGRLICLWDDNRVTIDGPTALTFSEDVARRFRAYGWQVLRVRDGNDPASILEAFRQARADEERPSLLVCRTRIAWGSPHKEGLSEAHGAPLGSEEVRLTKERLGFPPDAAFFVPEAALRRFRRCLERGARWHAAWKRRFESWSRRHPERAAEWHRVLAGGLPAGWDAELPNFAGSPPIATRSAFGRVLEATAPRLPELIGGSADLTPSNNTRYRGAVDFQRATPGGRYLRFGVREHAMGGILSGLALHGGLRPYGGTFLVFADYLRPAVRLAALMRLPVLYVFTHDSLAVGEDGPTHQPVEHLASLRILPDLVVLRPADATETVEAWRVALERTAGPTALILSRQNLPVLDRTRLAPAQGLRQGAYVLSPEPRELEAVILASGSEVHTALAAQGLLAQDGRSVRVVSVPSWELFAAAPAEVRASVLPPGVTARVAVEAGVPFGWERFVGPEGRVIGVDRFGASAPGAVVLERYGFTAERVAAAVEELLGRATG